MFLSFERLRDIPIALRIVRAQIVLKNSFGMLVRNLWTLLDQTASKGGGPADSSGSSSADTGATNKEPQWWNFLASRTEPTLLDEDASTEWSEEMTERYYSA